MRLDQLWIQLPADRRQAISSVFAQIVARRLVHRDQASSAPMSLPTKAVMSESPVLSPAWRKEGDHELP